MTRFSRSAPGKKLLHWKKACPGSKLGDIAPDGRGLGIYHSLSGKNRLEGISQVPGASLAPFLPQVLEKVIDSAPVGHPVPGEHESLGGNVRLQLRDQRWLFIPDGTNNVVWILDRASLGVVDYFGRLGKNAGQFYRLHNLAIDSRGNLYTTEVNVGQRLQKFDRIGG